MWLELLRERPALAAELLGCVRSELVPAFSRAQLESGDLSEHAPAAYHADAVVTLGDEDPALAVIVEVQLRPDQRKHLSWPAYLATARARLGCPAVLLVICPDDGVAAWARRSIRLGHPGLVLTPLVLGPEEVPVLTDWGPGVAAPELAVLPETARRLLEAMMESGTREYKSDFARRYYSQGEAKGEVKLILAVLSARGISVSEQVHTRISECTDLEQLETWGRRAATADSIDDLFE